MNARILTIIGAAMLVISGCSSRGNVKVNDSVKADSITVKVMEIHPFPMICSSSYVGKVESSKSTVISCQYPGTLTSLAVHEGQYVNKGDVIAEISSESITAAYEIAKSNLEQARDGYSRLSIVHDSGSVADVKIVDMRTRLNKAEAAEAAACKAVENCKVKAPFSGVIDKVLTEQGVELGALVPIAELVDVSGVEIHFPVPEKEYADIKVGSRATVSVPALEKEISARVSSKGVVASQLSHSYDCTLKFVSDRSGLMPGMVCKVFLESSAENGIVIPGSAVMTDMEGRYVWTVQADTVQKKYVTVGGYASKGIIVTGGLYEGNLVIIEGSNKVSTGMQVKAIR
ncbi:MAG: efflux RND transporter periplasmic adaptor subunit [Bacteroidales bacterium]|nr:efflux RND transporter periplasmic adaptor subunit [Bacteroidales bacterium]MCI2144776.1 efflux RND transporter periplasmic adaptor subunit [Bacteroidales bacterium]